MTANLLMTDGYKFSMAEAGWPLRDETFYASHRRGGLQLIPLDVEKFVQGLLPRGEGWEQAAQAGYDVGAGVKAAFLQPVTVRAVPKFSWVFDREPIFSVTGPSGLVSWLEPLALMLNYRVQVATLAFTDPEALAKAVATVTCEAQRQLVLETLESVGRPAPSMQVDTDGYVARVRAQARALVEAVGDSNRIFEVGLRAATCVEQHLLALDALKSVGITRTSHVYGAVHQGMVAVGTMGHEHVQRYGSDAAAFAAMVERRPHRSSFLLDTFDTIRSGLPAAIAVMARRPAAYDSVRYDSGDKAAQLRHAVAESKRAGVSPVHILEDGFDLPLTQQFEALRVELGLPPDRVVYGYGGHLVAKPAGGLTRDRVAAVYKLSRTGALPVMKFGDEAGEGKRSVPGEPVVFRRGAGASGPFGLIGQAGETPPPGYQGLSGAPAVALQSVPAETAPTVALSLASQSLVDDCTRRRHA